jgi:ABC-type glycerol-3-phosphate transport system permease component
MNSLKKLLGFIWMILGPSIIVFLIVQAIDKISVAAEGIARMNTTLQWSIIILIFIPICAGLVIFGWYGVKGEYDHLPENSTEL